VIHALAPPRITEADMDAFHEAMVTVGKAFGPVVEAVARVVPRDIDRAAGVGRCEKLEGVRGVMQA